MNTTPTPPATPTPTPPLLLAEDEENQNLAARQAEEWALSSGWEISSENSEAGFARIGEEKEEKKKKKKKRKLRDYPSEKSSSNIFSRGLRRAGKCIGTAVLASGKKIWPFGAGAARGSRLRDLDGTAEDAVVTNGGEGFYKKVKRTLLLRKEEPVHLKPAKVRMMLD